VALALLLVVVGCLAIFFAMQSSPVPQPKTSDRARASVEEEPAAALEEPVSARKESVVAQAAPRTPAMDFFSEGVRRGQQWKAMMRGRQAQLSKAEVRDIAERMTADYVKKGIDAEGEKRFVEGFTRAVGGE